MLTYNEALAAILERTDMLPHKRLRLESLIGHALAEPILAKSDLPMFDNSAVDGYGVRISDTLTASESSLISLKLLAEIRAGSAGEIFLAAGGAIRIFTGAVVPPSVEAVVMREYCRTDTDTVLVSYAPSLGENIRRQGEELKRGEEIIPAGMRVTPPVVGVLAAQGYSSFVVREKPRVSIVVTGDEIVKPGLPLKPGQIYDANSYSLQAAIAALGIEEFHCLYTRDTRRSTKQGFLQAIEQADVIISSGGVSVGDYDYVKDVLEEIGVKTVFWRIAMKPGKPVYFGTLKKGRFHKLIFGLPGNPVSVLVTYHQLVKPALLKMMGVAHQSHDQFNAALVKPLKKKPGRLDFVRGRLGSNGDAVLLATATAGQESHMLSGLAKANCLMHFAAEESFANEGCPIPIDMLDWYG